MVQRIDVSKVGLKKTNNLLRDLKKMGFEPNIKTRGRKNYIEFEIQRRRK